MTEVTAVKSSPEEKTDHSDGSNVTSDHIGTTSGQGRNVLPVATTSEDNAQSGESQTALFQYNLSDSDEDDSNETDDLYRFSDNEFIDNGDSGSPRDTYQPNLMGGYLDNNESYYHTIIHDNADSREENKAKIKQNVKNDKCESMITYDNTSSSDEETDFIPTLVASNDGGESSIIKDVPAGPSNEQKYQSSSDEETNFIPSLATFIDFGESSKTKDVPVSLINEEKNQSSSDEETNCIPSLVTSNNGGESRKTKDAYAGPSNKEENESSTDEETDCIPNEEQAAFNDCVEYNKTNDLPAGPSNEEKCQIKTGPKNKAERKLHYTVPFKKFKKF